MYVEYAQPAGPGAGGMTGETGDHIIPWTELWRDSK